MCDSYRLMFQAMDRLPSIVECTLQVRVPSVGVRTTFTRTSPNPRCFQAVAIDKVCTVGLTIQAKCDQFGCNSKIRFRNESTILPPLQIVVKQVIEGAV